MLSANGSGQKFIRPHGCVGSKEQVAAIGVHNNRGDVGMRQATASACDLIDVQTPLSRDRPQLQPQQGPDVVDLRYLKGDDLVEAPPGRQVQ